MCDERHSYRRSATQPVCEGLEGSRIDAKPLNFSVEQGLSRDGQGRKTLQLDPGPQVDEQAWLDSIRDMSSTDLAKRLGITDRQVSPDN